MGPLGQYYELRQNFKFLRVGQIGLLRIFLRNNNLKQTARIAMYFCQEFNFNNTYFLSPKVIDVSYERKSIIFSENIRKLHSKVISWQHS